MNTPRPTLRNTLVSALLMAPALGLLALPAQAEGFRDFAQVVSSIPVYERINTPRRDCWIEQVGFEPSHGGREHVRRDYGGAIIGGIVGGLLGNTVGEGSGRRVATAVGAATGAIVGDRIDNADRVHGRHERPRHEERCRVTDHWSERITGYNVVYRYQGREFSAFMPFDPGRKVRVLVNVSLAEHH